MGVKAVSVMMCPRCGGTTYPVDVAGHLRVKCWMCSRDFPEPVVHDLPCQTDTRNEDLFDAVRALGVRRYSR